MYQVQLITVFFTSWIMIPCLLQTQSSHIQNYLETTRLQTEYLKCCNNKVSLSCQLIMYSYNKNFKMFEGFMTQIQKILFICIQYVLSVLFQNNYPITCSLTVLKQRDQSFIQFQRCKCQILFLKDHEFTSLD